MNLLIFLSFLTLISANSFSCPGITYTIPRDTITSSYKEAFDNATQEIKKFRPEPDGHVIFEWLKIHFNLTGIKYADSNIVYKFNSITINKTEIKVSATGSFTGTYNVNYSFSILGINLLYGTAKVNISAGDAQIVQRFIGNEVKSAFESKVTITPTDVKSLLFSEGIKHWIKKIAEKGSLTGPLRIIEKSIDTEILKFYSKWLSYKPFKRDDLQVVFNNELDSLEDAKEGDKELGLVNFCMRTKIGIENRPYNKTVYHPELLPKLNSTIKGRSCISFGVIAGTLDVYGKARDKMFNITADNLNMTQDVDAFIQTMPSLRMKYSTMKNTSIGCRSNSALSIMKIRVNGKNKMQIPIVCYFGEEDGDNLITIEFVVRSNYTYEVKDVSNTTVKAKIGIPELYSISYNANARPVEDEMSLQKIARAVTTLLKDQDFFDEDIAVGLNFGKLKPKEEDRKGDQICFIYE